MRFVEAIAAAGYNVFNLTADQIEIDLVSDVPAQSPLAEVRAAGTSEAAVDLDAAARALYGDWRFVFTTKCRGSELALARTVARPNMTILTTGLFRTTQRAFATNGAKVEVMPAQYQVHGSSDLSLTWLGERFAASPVYAVLLEPANNAMFGWPMQLARLREVKQACTAHGAKLFLDATRLFSNCVALGETGLELARAYLAEADAFVTSCAKECVVPMGGVTGVREVEQHRAVWLNAFEEGATLELAPHRAQLAAGFDAIRARPALLVERRGLLEDLAARLRAAGIAHVDPIGSHAVFALFPALATDRPQRNQELQAHLFARSGIRFLLARHPAHAGFVVRLPLAVACFGSAELDRIVAALRSLVDEPDRAPALVSVPSEAVHLAYFGRYALA